jgi:hypothetical protein
MELPLTEFGATNFGRPYKPSIYTPRLGHQPFRHITNMARPLMDSMNTAIRCPYSTLPRNGRVPKIRKRKKINIQVLQIYKGADILRNSAIGKYDRAPTRLIIVSRKSRRYKKSEVTKNREITIINMINHKNAVVVKLRLSP